MDFYKIRQGSPTKDRTVLYPDFKVGRSKDLMVRGQQFYAVWDSGTSSWSTDEYDVAKLVDEDLSNYYEKVKSTINGSLMVDYMSSFASGSWKNFKVYLRNLADNATPLDETLVFANTKVTKNMYSSKRLSYPLEEGSIEAYDEIIGTLYDKEERAKLEWAIGAVISGDAKDIQKFLVLYGEMGSGKSTMLNIIGDLFDGYWTAFDAKSLGQANNQFSTEVFKSNPLVAIQHDGDLSKIEDNTKLNSIVSHEWMTMNEKYKSTYMARVNCFLFLGSNKPVKITDAKSGIIRRLIDVQPTGNKIPVKRYHNLMSQVQFELGAIASHCLNVYYQMGKNYYEGYKPLSMISQTDVFFNFVENHYYDFKENDGVSLKQAYELYKLYCDETLLEFKLPRHRFREELKSYFTTFDERLRIGDETLRSYYSTFRTEKFINVEHIEEEHAPTLVLDSDVSIFDEYGKDLTAQYATVNETPMSEWDSVKTTLKDIDTSKIHYVKPAENHIVIDFDLKDADGKKDMGLNIEAASKFPPTYAEFSKGGGGVHLHYIYDGDIESLGRVYAEDIEIKVFTGKSSLRRRFTKGNTIPIATISSGLPQKEKKMIDFEAVKSEQKLRQLITRNLHKEIHAGTKPSMDFMFKILKDAYDSGLQYDITDMRQQVLVFATNSTNQSTYCLRLFTDMKFKSEDAEEKNIITKTKDYVFFDVEIYPNLFVVVWKVAGGRHVIMINPKPSEIEALLTMPLIGHNVRRYDNHMLYGAYIGYNNQQLYQLSQDIIVHKSRNAFFREAYNLSHVDTFDYTSDKMGLKKWMIKLGINHMEMDIPWNEPVPDHLIQKVVEYCCNDVDATEAVFNYTQPDYIARQILADLSGLPINSTTQAHSAKIIFGDDTKQSAHKKHFEYTDLSETFPGYKYEFGKSSYRGDVPSEGGYVYSEPGMYANVTILDVASMHPTSAVVLNIFGKYTKPFDDLIKARLSIKHKDYKGLDKLLNGVLKKYISDDEGAMNQLSHALKIVLNTIYGMTSASFDNPFRDDRNKDNIVAKRGALFMIDLKYAVQEKGFIVAHIKTDSIKIVDATPEIIKFVEDFGKKYGYSFEHEEIYSRFCLVNKSVFISRTGWTPDGRGIGNWSPTGAQFAHPYVFKTLFSKEPIVYDDLKETRNTETAIYMSKEGEEPIFIGKIGEFVPVKEGGYELLRENSALTQEKTGKRFASVGDTKGYRWVLASAATEEDVDMQYYINRTNDAVDTISKYGDFEWFTS